MNTTKTNILFNFAGKIIPSILSIVAAPFYLHYLGVEYYGIIGFFASIQAFLLLLDGGISPTLNREVARLSVFPEKSQEMRNLARTLEVLCWILALCGCTIALLLSPFAAKYWLNSENIPQETLRWAFYLMSFSFTFQWLVGFYGGGLIGLQKQILFNLINIFLAIPRLIGSLIILIYLSPTIYAILVWQLIITILNCVLMIVFFWGNLPRDLVRPKFDRVLLKGVWRYAAGIFGTSIVVLILTQTDKLILSKMLTLEQFGYYTLAQTLAAMGISTIVSSIIAPYFPQFSQIVAKNKTEELKNIYHRASQVMSFFLIPTVCSLVFYSYQILLVWTRNTDIAENTYILLTLVAIGSGLNGLMHVPYYMQLANGITKIGFWQNLIAIAILIPLMVYGVTQYGAVGGAVAWVLLNVGYIIFSLPFMHRIILKNELKYWYIYDVGIPIVVTFTFGGVFYCLTNKLLSNYEPTIISVFVIAIITLLLYLICAFVTPTVRNFGVRIYQRYE